MDNGVFKILLYMAKSNIREVLESLPFTRMYLCLVLQLKVKATCSSCWKLCSLWHYHPCCSLPPRIQLYHWNNEVFWVHIQTWTMSLQVNNHADFVHGYWALPYYTKQFAKSGTTTLVELLFHFHCKTVLSWLLLPKAFCFLDSESEFFYQLFIAPIWRQVYSVETCMTAR